MATGFQTHPCGVEVAGDRVPRRELRRFRRTLVGLKLRTLPTLHPPVTGFRRTLVGLKSGRPDHAGQPRQRFRRTLVGLKSVLTMLP